MRRAFRYAAVAVLALAVIAAAGMGGLFFLGPTYIERSVVPDIGRSLGLGDFHIDVRRIGFKGVDIGALRIGEKDHPALTVGPVLINYTPGRLLQGRVDAVSVGGATLFCGYRNGGFYLRGLDMRKIRSRLGREAGETPTEGAGFSSFPVGTLRIDNGVVVFDDAGTPYRLPFDVALERDEKNLHAAHAVLTLYLRGETVRISGDVDLRKRTARVAVDAHALDAARFADLTGRLPDLTLSGLLDVSGTADFRFDPPAADAASANLTFRSRKTKWAGVSLAPFSAAGKPLTASLDWNKEPALRISLPPIQADGPVPIIVSDVGLEAHRAEGGISIKGRGTVAVRKTPDGAAALLTVDAPWTLPFQFGAEWQRADNQWRFHAAPDSGDGERIAMHAAGAAVSFKIGDFAVEGAGAGGISADCRMSAVDLIVSAGDVRATISQLTAKGRVQRGEEGRAAAKGTVTLSGGGLEAMGKALRLKGVGMTLPLQWPVGGQTGPEGAVAIEAIAYGGRHLGALEGTLRQTPAGFILSAEHWSRVLSGMGVWVSGQFPVFEKKDAESRVDVSASWPESSPDLNLGSLIPSAKGVMINGDLSAKGHFRFGASGPSGVLEASFKNGWMRRKEQGIVVDGVDATVRLPYLPDIHSAPAQELTIRKAAFGQAAITNAAVAFQIEPTGSLLIEQSRFRWAGGRVSGHAVRIAPGTDVYNVVLYCDRLSLAEVLRQFGAAEAEGEGTVNGRVPIRLAKGDVTFDDGFLYSTPGDGGTIHVSGAAMLTAGIPKGTAQFSQIDLAREAMKDYRYEWAKLRLNTEGEDLIMALHLDGKPMNPLPFVYKKETGGFVRVEDDQVGSRFQGIRLDVNFRLPLNRILQYKHLFY